MHLRTAKVADIDRMLLLMHATIDASYPAHYPPRALEMFKNYHSVERTAARIRDGWFLLAEDSGALVGTAALVGDEIFAVFVDPTRQGAGIGRMLMDALEERARIAGLPRVRLDASLPSTGFYSARGYRFLGPESLDAGEGQTLDWWRAEKALVD